MVAIIENVATASLTVIAGALSLVAVRAWWYSRSPKVLMLAVAFVLFFVKGIILSIGLFLQPTWGQDLMPKSVAIDVAILIIFYAAVLRRSGV